MANYIRLRVAHFKWRTNTKMRQMPMSHRLKQTYQTAITNSKFFIKQIAIDELKQTTLLLPSSPPLASYMPLFKGKLNVLNTNTLKMLMKTVSSKSHAHLACVYDICPLLPNIIFYCNISLIFASYKDVLHLSAI